jgi:hemolysin activation/secretion protein
VGLDARAGSLRLIHAGSVRSQGRWSAAAAALLLVSWHPALAQQFAPQVNPGAINRENQQTIQQLEQLREIPPTTGPTVTAPAQPTVPQVPPGGPTFELKTVTFSASAFLSENELQALAAPYIGHRVDLSQLYALVAVINARYEAMGIPTASAVLPRQHVEGGSIHIDLIEGRLGKTTFEGNIHITDRFISDRLPLAAGEVLNVPDLARQIGVFDRINDVQVRAALQPGTGFGQTDVTLSVLEPPRDSLDFSVDNWGLNSTGTAEGAFLYRRATVIVPDDRLTLYGIGNPGDLSGNIGYNLPVGTYGGRFGVSYGITQTRVLNGPYQNLEIKGHSQTGSFDLSQPLIATEKWLMSGLLNLSVIASENTQGSFTQTSDLTKKGGPGLLISYIDPTTTAQITTNYAYGSTQYDTLGNSGSFNLLTGTYGVTQALPFAFSLNIDGAWQQTGVARLAPDQLFELGGPNSVRGYQSNLVAGFSGAYAQVELHRDMSALVNKLDLFGFVDAGRVYSPQTPEKKLLGVGIGADYAVGKWANIQLMTGWPLEQVAPGQSNIMVYFRIVFHAL